MKERGQFGGPLIWTMASIGLIIGMLVAIPGTMDEAGTLYKEYFHDQVVIQQKEIERTFEDSELPNLAIMGFNVTLYAKSGASDNSPNFSINFSNYGGATAAVKQQFRCTLYSTSGEKIAKSDMFYNDGSASDNLYEYGGTADDGNIEVNEIVGVPANDKTKWIKMTLEYSDLLVEAGDKYRLECQMMWYNSKGKQFVEPESVYVVAQ